ncbi:NADP-dependent oxidoreductase [Planctomonas sp. JC2975]|uniref:quinone oxidoreductase family protein n=1 Tax=Planctomonas sp. JC2975 TaxID=2729626 RepID=UPI00147510E0|nr:NADP-dependent oxidoreductase [Planctomonas sp. JC2975]NNC13479.1 NADP-dependent oxidoreductase [Planctomonas sp. JC2975]
MQTVIQYARLGGPEVLEAAEKPDPVPGEGKVLVASKAIGVNPIDWKLRRGIRPSEPIETPRRLGSDVSGVISALGPGVTDWSVGDEVVVRGASGAYASEVVASEGKLVRKPADVSFEDAAALGVPAGTAYQVVVSLGPGEGDVLLIHGASGAVGQAAVQFARARGVTVVGTASANNLDRLRDLGAIALEYGDGLVDRVRAAVPQGVDYVLDMAGTDAALQASFDLVADRSHIGTIVVGFKAAELGIKAWSGGSPVPLTPEEEALRAEGLEAALAGLADGTFQVEIGATYPLTQAAEAHRVGEAGSVRGKIILVP